MLLFPEGCCCSLFPMSDASDARCLTEGLECCNKEGLHPHMNIPKHHMIAPSPLSPPPPPPHAPSLPLPRCKDQLLIGTAHKFEAPMLQGMHAGWRALLRRSLPMLMTQPPAPPSQPQPLGGLRQGCWRSPQLKCTRPPSLPGCTCAWESGDGQSPRFVPFAWPVSLFAQCLAMQRKSSATWSSNRVGTP